MKVLFIADHHIKLGQKGVPVEWAELRFCNMWNKVEEIARRHGITTIIHGGDIFDSVPSMPELAIYGYMLEVLKGFRNIIYPGNHEAVTKHTSFMCHLRALSQASIVDDYIPEEEVMQLFWVPNTAILPYTDLKKKNWHGDTGKILFTHVRGAIPPHVTPEIDLDLFAGWDTVYAGDLHSHKLSQRNIVYPGSPASTTFRRSESAGGDNGIIIVDTITNEWEFVDLGLPQLIKATVTREGDIVPTHPNHTVYELVGAETSVSKVKHKDLVSKKISNVEVEDGSLHLSTGSVQDELAEYLKEKKGIQDASPYVSLMEEIT